MRLLAALLFAVLLAHAQPATPAVYKVEFLIPGDNDAPAQHLSLLVHESAKGIFQSATRVPLPTASPRFADVGVTVECVVKESNGKAALSGSIELSAITGYVSLSAISQPIIAQRKITFESTLEFGAPTVVTGDHKPPAVEATVTRR